ncbi:unnamed protein product [Amaranthus hypochondriacus]
MSMSLPCFMALQEENGDKLVCYIETDGKECLQLNATQIFDPRAKFAVENGPHGLVHIRSFYNNKYWIRSTTSTTKDYIVPAASEPMEEKYNCNCTLFEPVLSIQDSILTVDFIHKQTGLYLIATTNSKINDRVLSLDSTSKTCFRVFDYGSLVKLPKYVAFKGNNNKYLITDYFNRIHYNHKFAGTCLSDKRTNHEIYFSNKGHIHVKNINANKFWRFRSLVTKIFAPDGTSHCIKASEVEAIQLDEPNTVCLRIPSEKLFLGMGFDVTSLRHALLPIGTAVTPETRFEVVEPVINRRVDHVQYRLGHARIYGRTPRTMFRAEICNDTDLEHQHCAEICYTKSRTSSWNNGVITTSSVKTSFKTGYPYIVDGVIEVSTQLSTESKWGECMQFSEQVKSISTVPVPAKHKAIITVMGSEAKCDVPFSYVQTDKFYDGSEMVTKFDDGVYTGIETYDFQHKTIYQPL